MQRHFELPVVLGAVAVDGREHRRLPQRLPLTRAFGVVEALVFVVRRTDVGVSGGTIRAEFLGVLQFLATPARAYKAHCSSPFWLKYRVLGSRFLINERVVW